MCAMQPIDVVDNLDGEFADPSGDALPPCIVMERGESLDLWLQRAQPDWSQAFTVRTTNCELALRSPGNGVHSLFCFERTFLNSAF